ncbi:7-methylguanosine phosphate-specific 5'-nucleotidase [Trichonephila clavipes]|nr:7-methylguanosine phosphate-specific 5'-nucleotidase [Trichonephila clavipes]
MVGQCAEKLYINVLYVLKAKPIVSTQIMGIFEHSSKISQDYKTQTTSLYNHYHPIEVDPHLTKAEKVPHMIEWYTKCVDMMPSSGITKDSVPDMVADLSVHLRDGCDVLFESLYKHNVPLLIFSAGIGDVLKEVLQRDKLLYPNVKIIANFMQFDEKVEENLDKYLDTFDIVLSDDQTMDVVIGLLQNIL